METKGHWDNLPTDNQKTIMDILYIDSERDKICDKRLVNKGFKDMIKNIQIKCDDSSTDADKMKYLLKIEDESAFLESLYWLEKKGMLSNEVLSKELVSSIAYKGFTKVLIWLKENRHECLNYHLMDYAAKGGKLETLIWLNENAPSSFTTNILPMSTRRGGSLDVIGWVLDNKGYIYTDDTIDYEGTLSDIVQECDLDTMKFLVRKRPEWLNECLEYSATNDRLDLLEWLYDNSDGYVFSKDLFRSLGELFCEKEIIEFVYDKQFKGDVESVRTIYERYKSDYDDEYRLGDENTLSWLLLTYSNEKEWELRKRQNKIEKKEMCLKKRESELKKKEEDSKAIDRNLNIKLLNKVVANLSMH